MPHGVLKPKFLKSINEQITEIDEQIATLKEQKKKLLDGQKAKAIVQLLGAS